MFVLIGCVNLVAGTAATPFGIFVDVEEVQVTVAIAEICQLRGLGVKGYCFVVALEAEGVVFGLVRHVELPGEVLLQDATVITPVRVVTGVAVPLFDRTMQELLFGHILPHFGVAGKTQISARLHKQAWMV